jgi:hypothetical protein
MSVPLRGKIGAAIAIVCGFGVLVIDHWHAIVAWFHR